MHSNVYTCFASGSTCPAYHNKSMLIHINHLSSINLQMLLFSDTLLLPMCVYNKKN